jgi:nuclear transport factor 2 (NTF2) superfamily protein
MSGRTSVDPRPDIQRAREKVRAAEDASNAQDVESIVMQNSIDCQWRNRAEFLWGREQIRAYIERKWRREIERRVITELWAVDGDRIALRFVAEFRDDNRAWFRAHGGENWELNSSGQIRRRFTSVNEHVMQEHERVLRWPLGVRPDDHPTLSELSL